MELAMHITEYAELEKLMAESGREYDTAKIKKAYEFAADRHASQKRRSGEPYIIHPLSVAAILIGLGMDSESLMAGLLHDVIEDTDTTLEELSKEFGKEVAQLTDGVTKLGKIPYSSREEQQAENLRKMLMAMAEDIRVIIIKFADRMHNLSTLEYVSPQKQRDKALECLEVYAPIAHRLGIRTVKEYMEDVSLKYLDYPAYKEIEENLEAKSSSRREFLENTKALIKGRVMISIPNVYIEGRVKSIYSIYRKMFIQGKDFDEIFDIFALRVIVDTIEDCYNILGIVHDMFQPLPNRFKDYISTPKPNMYQSLHTTVISKTGIPFEVQIRTWEMHHTAEYGIAAHWKYKLGGGGGAKNSSLDERLAWIRQMLENQEDNDDVTDLVHSIKSDLIPEEVFVFTPKGDVVNLPLGSTVIDYAYSIHSAIGNRMIGAKVDHRIVPLDYKVKTGEIIEILTTKENGKGPNRDWLSIVRTSEARNKIRAWFKKEKRSENIVEGKIELDKELKRSGMILSDELLNFMVENIGKKHSCSTADDFYAAIGYGGIQLWKIVPRVREEYQRINKAQQRGFETELPELPKQSADTKVKTSGGVLVDGMDGCLVKFSRCCNPLPGDDIIGFVTRGFGVSIHKKSCPNVPKDMSLAPEPERWVTVHWQSEVKDEFKSTLHIVAEDRAGLLADVTIQLSNMHIFIHSLNSRQDKVTGNAVISATINITGMAHLNSIIERLKSVPGIISIDRS